MMSVLSSPNMTLAQSQVRSQAIDHVALTCSPHSFSQPCMAAPHSHTHAVSRVVLPARAATCVLMAQILHAIGSLA